MVAYFSRDEHMRQADELQHLQRRLHFEIQRRQQAEAQLLTSQQTIEDISTHWITPSFWQSVFDASPLGLFAVDVTPEQDFVMAAVNPVIETWTGRSAVEICGQTPEAAFGPEMGAEIRANYQRCLDCGAAIAYEEFVPFQKEETWSQTTLTPLRNPQGEIYRLVGNALDITERKQGDLARQRLVGILEASPICVFMTDVQGYCVYTNDRWQAIAGLSADEALGLGWAGALHPEDRDRAFQLWHEAAQNQSAFRTECRFQRPDGSVSWVISQAVPLPNQDGYVGTITDISDRKAAEEQLQQQTNILQSILDNMSEGVVVSDADGKFLVFNPAAAAMFGNGPTETNHEAWSEQYGLFHGDQVTPLAPEEIPLVRSLQGEAVDEFEIFVRHATAPEGLWTSVNGRPLLDEIGNVQGGLVVCRDISDRKKDEALLHQKTKTLRDTIKTLKQTQSQLVQTEKMSSLGQLVAGVAHEINNPVNFIYGNLIHIDEYVQDLTTVVTTYQEHYPNPAPDLAELIEEKEVNFLLEDLPSLIDSMKVGSQRIREIVNSLRSFSRLDEADYKDVNLHEGIDSTLMILQNRLKATPKHPEIIIKKHYGDLPLIECYSGQLNQVFMNILVNALDALEERNQARSYQDIKADPNQITIATKLVQQGDEQQVEITFQDNALGIPKEIQSKIFDPFFTTKAIGQGTGLGMSISYQIITEKHHGSIRCQSKPGEGTTFIITIPVQQHSAAQPSADQASRPAS
ncbi:PAS domain-containing protein [Spirulina major]|uniref:PAS domain-containing protein n=1 Tax=Spirulina major TaxID=270636 RepID=UPI000A0283E2|nr:PAS domain-containing protein [Spirulina major]